MKLISFEGIEGSGKSTQIKLIYDWLIASNFKVKLLREPGSTDFGEKIRDLLLSNDSKISNESELLLMFSARSEMISNHLLDSAEDFILCDRYYHSSLAYQGYGRKLSLDFINNLIKNLNCPTPDLTIIYDLEVSTGFKRKSKDPVDRIESSGHTFFEDVRAGYIELSKSLEEVVLIDANNSPVDIHAETKKLIGQLIYK